MALGLILAMLIGALLGLLGAGGSILTVPLLVYVVGLDAEHAAATSLLVVGIVAAVGTMMRWETVRVRAGLTFGAAGLVGVPPGVWLSHRVPPAVLLAGFGALLLAACVRMLRADAAPVRLRVAPPAVVVGGGAVVGFATGFFGVGGGFLIVPALMVLLGLDLAHAAATSTFVIALNSVAGLAGHAAFGAVEWRVGMAFGGVALLAALLATPFAARVSPALLRITFATLLFVLGSGMLVRSLAGLGS